MPSPVPRRYPAVAPGSQLKVSPQLRQTLDHMEHAGELQLRSLKERVDAERMALKETMSLSRAAAVASVQQEVGIKCKIEHIVDCLVSPGIFSIGCGRGLISYNVLYDAPRFHDSSWLLWRKSAEPGTGLLWPKGTFSSVWTHRNISSSQRATTRPTTPMNTRKHNCFFNPSGGTL